MLSVSHAGLRGELGPFPDGHRHVSEAPPLSKPITTTSANNPTMGGDAFADAFESALSSFGSEIIAGDTITVDGDDPFAAAFMNSGAAQILHQRQIQHNRILQLRPHLYLKLRKLNLK